jgi:hypothetical protein
MRGPSLSMDVFDLFIESSHCLRDLPLAAQ